MQQLISEENRQYLAERFAQEVKNPVTLEFFSRAAYFSQGELPETQDDAEINEEEACRLTNQILSELSEVAGDKLTLIRHDVDSPEGQDAADAANLNPEMLPALAYSAPAMLGRSHYYGLPSGYEFSTLIDNIMLASQDEPELSAKTRQTLSTLTTPVSIMIFVTPT